MGTKSVWAKGTGNGNPATIYNKVAGYVDKLDKSHFI